MDLFRQGLTIPFKDAIWTSDWTVLPLQGEFSAPQIVNDGPEAEEMEMKTENMAFF